MTGADGYGVPGWVVIGADQVNDMLGRVTDDVVGPAGSARVGYLRTLLWVVGDGVAPATGRPDQPVTVESAEVEWWSALAAVRPEVAHLAPLREISERVGVVYRPLKEVGLEVAHATWVVVTWLLGLQDPQGPNGLPAWLYGGPTPTADELFREATAVEAAHGVRRSPGYWSGVYERAQRDAVRHRRMAMRMRAIERRSTSSGLVSEDRWSR